ncbi:sialate O-acetylesterase [Jiulongibacter sediminis]|uniref:sialate O-acetylesterase n=1 Tax=Jiulongibacter sediminis TaxID=1605367 RepID=UPI0026EA9B01|nr:sialate O-acetylesterase [Jiulongibacter sediminis]
MKKLTPIVLLFLICPSLYAQLKVANIFGDHMVLQRNEPIKVWGWNDPKEKISVEFNGQAVNTESDAYGNWSIELASLPEGGPLTMKVSDADESLEFADILMGEVWLCSGQSNMEWKVNRVDNAEEEIENANHPLIRHIEIPKALEFVPQFDFEGREWEVCSPETVGGFTAVGYFFARKLSAELGVPVGLVHSSWGGSHVETWISKEAMLDSEVLKDYAQIMPSNWEDSDAKMEKLTINRFHGSKDFDISNLDENDYLAPSYDFSSWSKIHPMYQWDWKGVPSFRGTVFIQKDIELTQEQISGITEMNFGRCTGEMWFYVNGRLVHQGYHEEPIRFKIQEGVLNIGKNSILVKFSENTKPEGWGVGLYGDRSDYNLKVIDKTIPLMEEDWYARPSWQSSRKYKPWMNNEGTLCYNAMIAPLTSLSIKGALWYQGESNAGRAYDYRKSFPLLIKDWRNQWGEEFPFYWVQLSSYGDFNDSNSGSDWAELREAQSMMLSLPKTGEAVTIDIGNPYDIHPTNKQDVGLRLALNALQNTYGQNLVGSGPRYQSMNVKKDKAIITFNNTGSGLKTSNKYGYLEGFEIAGADQKFYFAKAEIVGNAVFVSHSKVKQPKAVRYGWSNSPIDANLYNEEGLPASPFRTDDWKGVTEGVHFE